MCRKVTFAWLIIALLLTSKAEAIQYAFAVSFTDKNNTTYSLTSPLAYLSARAITRRTAYGIAVDSTDLPVNKRYIDSVLLLTGGKLHESSRWLNLCVILISDSSLIHTLDGKAFVSSTKLVSYYSGILHKAGNTLPSTASPSQKTTSDAAYYGNTWLQTAQVHGNYLHDNGYDGQGKLIAVLDAGFSGTDAHTGFDSMRNGGRLLDWHNFTLDTDFIYSYDTHGTKVLSTMAGYVPGTFVGSAPLASYALYVTEDGNSEQPIELYNMLCGAERADSLGADVITTSLGYNTFDDHSFDYSFFPDFNGKTTPAAKAANTATQKGILFVATAGNEGGNSWNNILTPGDADSALTIGSVDAAGTPAFNSGYGPTNAGGQIKPDVCGMGQPGSIFVPGGYGTENGTSFSTPEIAGWATCLWQANPTATPYQVRQAIIKCASSYSAPGIQLGYGIPDFECTEQLLHITDPPVFNPAKWVVAVPNPFVGDIILNVFPDTEQYVDFRVMDMTGKTVSATRSHFYKGYNAPVSITITGVPAGIYVLQAISPTHQQIIKLEKL